MNNTLKAALVGLVLAASMIGAGGAQANTRGGGSVLTPVAMKFFCRQNPGECAGGGAAQVTMSDDLVAMLHTINRRVNGSIQYTAERVDKWSLNPRRGDCEDYALSKRSALIKQGVPSGSLRIGFTHTRRGVPHAVLIVKTSRGDYVLDNMNSKIVSLQASGYNILMMSSSNPMRWTAG